MGKTQSKRSVDITTDSKKGAEDAEVTGKLEKIEDLDQKQVNGDATPQETNEAEKKDADESENDKDLTTEKTAGENEQSNGESGDQNNVTVAAAASVAESTKEDCKEDTSKDAAAVGAEEISPLADESMKKSKKEKVKKKWSFRSISFGKKDKQKPAKTEEANGEAEKTAAEGVTETSKGSDEAAAAGGGDGEAKPAENLENGDASEKELNGQKTPTLTEEKPIEVVASDETKATTTTTTAPVSTASSVSNETAMDNQTETKAAAAISAVETVEVSVAAVATAAVASNGAADAAENNGVDATVEAVTEGGMVESAAENNKTIPTSVANDEGCDGEKSHQNGMAAEEPEAEQSKSQIEVKTNTDNTPAANLASSSTSTSSDPNVQNKNSENENNSHELASKAAIEIEECTIVEIVTVTPEAATIETETTEIDPLPTEAVPATEDKVETPPVEDVIFVVNAAPAEVEISEAGFEIVQAEAETETEVETTSNERAKQKSTPASLLVETQPPPLPISPPPSQVSVFAFKDNNDGDKIETDEVLDTAATTCQQSTATTAPVSQAVEDVKEPIELEKHTAQIDSEDDDSAEEAPVAAVGAELQEECNDIALNIETAMINAAAPDTLVSCVDVEITVTKEGSEMVKEEKILVAAAIVDEVTEKAVAIVQQQQEQQLDRVQEEVELKAVSETETHINAEAAAEATRATESAAQPQTELENEIIAFEVVLPNEAQQESGNLTVTIDNGDLSLAAVAGAAVAAAATALEIETEIIQPIQAAAKAADIAQCAENDILPNLAPTTVAQVESENQDYSLIVNSASKELCSLNDVDEFVSTTKDIVASAKDLKENAAAEITTQDLPVTCE